MKDDGHADLHTLHRRQRYEGVQDIDATLADNIMRKRRFRYVCVGCTNGGGWYKYCVYVYCVSCVSCVCWLCIPHPTPPPPPHPSPTSSPTLPHSQQDLAADEEYDHDGTVNMYERKKPKSIQQQQHKDKQRQVSEFHKVNRMLEACVYCFSSARRPKHLTLSIGQTVYLGLPHRCVFWGGVGCVWGVYWGSHNVCGVGGVHMGNCL